MTVAGTFVLAKHSCELPTASAAFPCDMIPAVRPGSYTQLARSGSQSPTVDWKQRSPKDSAAEAVKLKTKLDELVPDHAEPTLRTRLVRASCCCNREWLASEAAGLVIRAHRPAARRLQPAACWRALAQAGRGRRGPTPSCRPRRVVPRAQVACLQYGLVSTSITLFNRAVFSVYHFNFPSFVTLVQIVVSLIYMYALKWTGHMELGAVTAETSRKVGDARRGRRALGAGAGRIVPGAGRRSVVQRAAPSHAVGVAGVCAGGAPPARAGRWVSSQRTATTCSARPRAGGSCAAAAAPRRWRRLRSSGGSMWCQA